MPILSRKAAPLLRTVRGTSHASDNDHLDAPQTGSSSPLSEPTDDVANENIFRDPESSEEEMETRVPYQPPPRAKTVQVPRKGTYVNIHTKPAVEKRDTEGSTKKAVETGFQLPTSKTGKRDWEDNSRGDDLMMRSSQDNKKPRLGYGGSQKSKRNLEKGATRGMSTVVQIDRDLACHILIRGRRYQAT